MNTKTLFTSKTFWTGISTICLGLGLFFSGEQELQELVISVIGVAFTILRLATDKPISGLK